VFTNKVISEILRDDNGLLLSLTNGKTQKMSPAAIVVITVIGILFLLEEELED
jgi:hypothetical protein